MSRFCDGLRRSLCRFVGYLRCADNFLTHLSKIINDFPFLFKGVTRYLARYGISRDFVLECLYLGFQLFAKFIAPSDSQSYLKIKENLQRRVKSVPPGRIPAIEIDGIAKIFTSPAVDFRAFGQCRFQCFRLPNNLRSAFGMDLQNPCVK